MLKNPNLVNAGIPAFIKFWKWQNSQSAEVVYKYNAVQNCVCFSANSTFSSLVITTAELLTTNKLYGLTH